MSELERQNSLLNDYVKTLERQNESKSNEIRTLTMQNDQLIKQCQSLRQKSRQTLSTSNVSSTQVTSLQATIQRLESELKQSKSAYNLLSQQTQHGGEVQKLREDLRRVSEQKLILQQYKQKLERELKQMGFTTFDSYANKIRQAEFKYQEQIKKSKVYESRIVEYERKVTLLSNEVMIKNSQIQRLNDMAKLVTNNSTKNQQQIYQKRVSEYQKRVTEYETKITQLTNQLTVTRSEIDRLKEKQSQYTILLRDNENYKRQIQTLNTKITSISSSSVQVNSYQTTINSLRNDQKEWQRERQQLQIKISDLQTQVVEKSNTIGQLMLREEYLRSKESGDTQKAKEIDRLNSIIRTLRIEIEDYKKTISVRESTIKTLQTKISSNQYSKSNQIASIQRIVEEKNAQMKRLIDTHNQKVSQLTIEIDKYRSASMSNVQINNELQSLREQNTFLKRESQNNQSLIQQLQREKESLKIRIRQIQEQMTRSRVNQSQIKTYVTKNDSSQTQLTRIVRQLRGQLEQVKRSNAVIHEENHKMHQILTEMSESQMQIPSFGNQSSIIRYHSPQNITSFHQQVLPSASQIRYMENQSMLRKSQHYQQPYFKSQMNIQKKRQMRNDRSGMSPVRDVKLAPNMSNKQKWESLQRKISALRVQNDQLKRTLLFQ